jgi:predicted ATPase
MDVDDERLSTLNEWLSRLELTGSVTAARVDDANVEVRVARTRNGRPRKADMIGLADVGLGVSQVLPVLVAILVASKGRIVYVEQPELHLHPRAQVKLAEILCEAARPDVYVLIETHSGLLLRGIQEAVARARVSPEKIRLHWFHRDKLGVTRVSSATLDARGRFGDWPVDFGDVELDIEDRFLRASLGASKK